MRHGRGCWTAVVSILMAGIFMCAVGTVGAWPKVDVQQLAEQMGDHQIPEVSPSVDTEFCLVDTYGNFLVIHLLNTIQGHFMTWGHIHMASLDKEDPEWTQYLYGSGTLYPVSHPTNANIAEFSIGMVGTTTYAKVRGSIEVSPIVYHGTLYQEGGEPEPYSLTVVGIGEECTNVFHP